MGEPQLYYFEDYEVGEEGQTAGRTITEADIVSFSGLSADWNAVHVDREAAARTIYGQRIAQGLLSVSAVTGLLARDAPHVLGSAFAGLAFLGLEWKFLTPVFIGDTISARHRVEDVRVASAGDKGVVRHAIDVVKQDETIAQSGVLSMLVALRDA